MQNNNDDSGFKITVLEEKKSDSQITELENKLEKEKDARKEERFIWILVVTILLNVCFFMSMNSFMGPVVIGILELIVFMSVAKKMGVEEVVSLLNRMISTIANATKN